MMGVSSLAAGERTIALDMAAGTGPLEFTVNTEADTVDPNPGDGIPGTSVETSLRAAIMEANAQPCPDGVIIHLPVGEYLLTIAGHTEDAAVSGDLDITGCVTILGSGTDQTIINADELDRVFDVHNGATLALEDVTVTGGYPPSDSGGGIRSVGHLALTRVVVEFNQVSAGAGGVRAAGTTMAVDCTFRQNWSNAVGGGINCSAHGSGVATCEITRSAIVDNVTGAHGGGLSVAGGDTAELTNCTISGNRADRDGAAAHVNFGTLTLRSCTVTGNIADFDNDGEGTGGGVRQYGGTITLLNTIVAGNEAPVGIPNDLGGTITSAGYNLIGEIADASLNGDVTGNLIGADPEVAPLADNGGLTSTHALSETSPALDTGSPDDCPATDQRGENRPADGDRDGTPRCDIGAFELIVFAGDFDEDGDVDLDDLAVFVDCMAGPGELPGPVHTTPGQCLDAFDFDGDEDVDMRDCGVLQKTFTGQ
jgi:CSLREA domain-containing protein